MELHSLLKILPAYHSVLSYSLPAGQPILLSTSDAPFPTGCIASVPSSPRALRGAGRASGVQTPALGAGAAPRSSLLVLNCFFLFLLKSS